MRGRCTAAAVTLTLALFLGAGPRDDPRAAKAVLVELFTSQG